jgi:O-antigen ligase
MQQIMNRHEEYLLRAGLCLLIVMIPFKPVWGSYSLILLSALELYCLLRQKKWERPPTLFFFVISLYFIRLLGVLWTDDLKAAGRPLETEISLLAIPLVLSLSRPSHETIQFALRVFVLMTLAVMTYSFVQLSIFIARSEYTLMEYIDVHFVTAQYYAQLNMLTWNFAHYSFLSVMIIYAQHILMYSKRRTMWYWVYFGAFSGLALLFFIFTGSLAGQALFVIAWITYAGVKLRRFFSMKLMGALFVVGVIGAIWLLATPAGKHYMETKDIQRYHYTMVALDAIKEKPLFGHGTGATGKIIQDSTRAAGLGFHGSIYEGKDANHPHNQYLTEAIQFGILGMLPLLIFLGISFRYACKRQNWILLCIIVTVGFFMLVESPVNSNKGVVPIVLLVSLLAWRSQDRPESETVDLK